MEISANKKAYRIDGRRFSTLAEGAAEFTRVFELTMPWNGNLDAFNDILRGGFGTPEAGFILVWQNSKISRECLGYGETLRWLESRVHDCHPSNIASIQNRITAARQRQGKTLFDTLIDIIREHDDIELRLE